MVLVRWQRQGDQTSYRHQWGCRCSHCLREGGERRADPRSVAAKRRSSWTSCARKTFRPLLGALCRDRAVVTPRRNQGHVLVVRYWRSVGFSRAGLAPMRQAGTGLGTPFRGTGWAYPAPACVTGASPGRLSLRPALPRWTCLPRSPPRASVGQSPHSREGARPASPRSCAASWRSAGRSAESWQPASLCA